MLFIFSVQDWWLNVEAYRVGSNSDTGLSYGFYAEYYATNDICVEPTDTKGSITITKPQRAKQKAKRMDE